MPKCISKAGSVEIWHFPAGDGEAEEWAVYGKTSSPIFCPSVGMAWEKAA